MSAGEEPALEGFLREDWTTLTEAGAGLFAQIRDIVHHRMADGEWMPWAEPGDIPALCVELRDVLAQLEEPIRQARTAVIAAERTARLRRINTARRSDP